MPRPARKAGRTRGRGGAHMSTLKKTLVVGTSSVLALAGVGGGIAVAAPSLGAQQDAPEAASQTEASAYEKTDIVTLDVVEGQYTHLVGSESDVSRRFHVAPLSSENSTATICSSKPCA